MKIKGLLLLLAILIVLFFAVVACDWLLNTNTISPSEPACIADEECQTPMDYLVRSNCPFGAACIEGACRVVCPDWTQYPDPSVNRSMPITCERDADCVCEHYLGPYEECVCHSGACLAIVETFDNQEREVIP